MSRNKLKIKTGDQVVVTTGKDKGKTGEVTAVVTEERRVIVQGINIVTKHVKPSQFSAGGIQKIEKSIHVSNVALVDPKTQKPTRVGYQIEKDGAKARVAKKSGEKLA